MFRFANENILYLLFGILLFVVAYIIRNRWSARLLKQFGNPELLAGLMPFQSPGRRNMKFTIYMVVFAFLILALSRPQFGSKLEEVKKEGIEIVLALDVSNSMRAQDIKPNRLVRAKQAITTLLGRMRDDKIGLIVFAGDAYTQIPITSDYVSAKMFLANTNTDMVSKQGTAIGSAIELGMQSFTQDEESSKVIVIISDGENHEGNAAEAAQKAAEKGVLIYTIGMGSTDGSPIPERNGQQGFVKDRQGNVVTSKMNPKMLGEIASIGGGKYFSASTGNVGLNKLYDELNKLDKAELESRTYSEYNDQYQYFLAIALLLLFIDALILERKNKRLIGLSLFKIK